MGKLQLTVLSKWLAKDFNFFKNQGIYTVKKQKNTPPKKTNPKQKKQTPKLFSIYKTYCVWCSMVKMVKVPSI